MKSISNTYPGQKTKNWIKSRLIAYAKSQKAA